MTVNRRHWAKCWIAILGLPLTAAGCSAGEGEGAVRGLVNVAQCTFDTSGHPIPWNKPDFDMNPDFFMAEPIDSNYPRFPANQIIIRIQNGGARLEDADSLVFWIFDSHEVARCVRGRMNVDGTPDWDSKLCDRSPGALGLAGEGRLFVGMTYETVSSFLVLNLSCPSAFVSANALGLCDDGSCPEVSLCPGRGSWISFSQFGSARPLPAMPAEPTEGLKPGFRVNDREGITASAFHVELCDTATVDGTLDNVLPVVEPNIVGTLDGSFKFDLASFP